MKHGRPQKGEEANVGAAPPPEKKYLQFIHPYGGLFRHVRAFLLLFYLWRPFFRHVGFFFYFCHLMGSLFRDGGAFLLLLSLYRGTLFHVGGLFWLAPHPTIISVSTHGPCNDINLNVKFVENVFASA